MNTRAHAEEMNTGQRFGFGENWSKFLSTLDEQRISEAERSLKAALRRETLDGLRFLDAGSGSGLFSLAARRLGATVHSFDFDPKSVACTAELKRRYFADDSSWVVEEASVLDKEYTTRLGRFDVVYSWGVLHHTGQMWNAIENVSQCVSDDGQLFIAIYNNMSGMSRVWTAIKRVYCKLPAPLSQIFAICVLVPQLLYSLLVHLVQGKLTAFIAYFRDYKQRRGMSWWHDQLDWIGGYPYEDAKPEEIFDFLRDRGFNLTMLVTYGGGIGCNEFVFVRDA